MGLQATPPTPRRPAPNTCAESAAANSLLDCIFSRPGVREAGRAQHVSSVAKGAPRLPSPPLHHASPSSTVAPSETAFWPGLFTQEGVLSSERALRNTREMGRVEGQNMLPDPHRCWLPKPSLLGSVPGSHGGRGGWALNGPALSPLPILPAAGRAPKLPWLLLPCWSCEPPREGRAPWALSGLPSGLRIKLPPLGKAALVSVKSQAQPNPTCARPG